MAFFDFLDDVIGVTNRAVDEAKKKRKPASTPGFEGLADQDPTKNAFPPIMEGVPEAPKPPGPKPFPGMISEENSAFLQKQNEMSGALKAKASGMLKKLKDSGMFAVGKFDDAIAKIESADINTTHKLADIVQNALTNVGVSPSYLRGEFEKFKEENTAFNRMVFKNPVPVPPIAVDPMKLESVQQGLDKALENMAVAATEEDRQFWSKQVFDLRKTLQQLQQRSVENAKRPALPEADQGPQPNGAIEGPAKAAGIPAQDFQAAVEELGKKLGLNLDEKVEFPLALQRLLNSPDLADVRPDFEAIGQMPGVGQVAQAGAEGEEAGQPQPMQDLHGVERQQLIELAKSKEWTWYEAIAFVLLSMTIKPAATIMLWHRAAKAGQLQAELIGTRRKMQEVQWQKRQDAELAKERRGRAAELHKAMAVEGFRQYGQAVDDQRTFRNEWRKLIFKAATTRQKAEQDPIAKAFQKDIENWLDLAAKASSAMEIEQAKGYMAKAEAMQLRLREYLGLPAFEEEVAK